jgi:hypothetical protein
VWGFLVLNVSLDRCEKDRIDLGAPLLYAMPRVAGRDYVVLEPPSGSGISVAPDGAHPLIVIPHGSGTPLRYVVRVFLLVWLGGWFAGSGSAVLKLWSGEADAPLVLWLAAWMLIGAFAVYVTYRAFRPVVPESLRLMPDSVVHDSGMPPFMDRFFTSHIDTWEHIFPKRTRTEFDRRTLQSLRLRETNDGNRLTVDVDASRLDIARSAGEIEREWLYQLLARRYSLPLPQAR